MLNYGMNTVVSWCDFSLPLLYILRKATASMCHKIYKFLLLNVVLFLVSFKKEVYYLKLWISNDTKIYENKIYS